MVYFCLNCKLCCFKFERPLLLLNFSLIYSFQGGGCLFRQLASAVSRSCSAILFRLLCNLNVMGAEIFSVGGRKLVFFPTVLLLRFCAFGSSVLPCELRSKMALIGVSDCQIQDNNDKTCEVWMHILAFVHTLFDLLVLLNLMFCLEWLLIFN